MTMQTEITGVERIYLDGGVTAALIKCDKQAALERCYFAFNGSNEDTDTDIVLHKEFGNARIEWIADEPAGLCCGQWVIYVSNQHDGVVVMKQGDGDEYEPVELENEWVDVLMIVRNFFAIERATDWNFERFYGEAA